MSEVAKVVVGDLRDSSDTRHQATNVYTKRQVKKLLGEQQGVLDGASTDLAADRRMATSKAMEHVHLPRRQSLLGWDGVSEARKLLAVNVANESIDMLQGRPERSSWVQTGIVLHEGLDDCLFYGQQIAARRRDELNAHFDDSFKRPQKDIDDLVDRLSTSVRASKEYLDSIPIDEAVYKELQDDLQEARSDYRADRDACGRTVENLVILLKQKGITFSEPSVSIPCSR